VDPAVLLVAFGLGLSYAAAPGAVNAETIRRGVSQGFGPAFAVQAGSITGDVGWAVLALLGLATLLQDTTLRATLGLAGGVLLLWFALSAIRGSMSRTGEPELDEGTRSRLSARGGFMTGVVLSVANPMGPIFWLGVGGGLAAGGVVGGGLGDAAAFIGAFAAGALAWSVGVSSVLAFARRWVTPGLFRVVDLLCGLAFGYFGVRVLVESIAILRG
jgi:threonine/homoserine/homoserine lactone efflux protein